MSTAISDDEQSDAGDAIVTSDIAPKKGRGRKSYKEEGMEDDEDTADAKYTNGDAAEEEEDEEDEDLEEDEYVSAPPSGLPCAPR